MQKRVLKTLYNERKKIEEKEKEIKRFTEDPLMFFNELQYDRDIIPNLLGEVSESLLIDYQKWQYPLVLRAIVENYNIAPFTLTWDEGIFPSPIYLVRNGYKVASISPYKSTFEILANETVKSLLREYKNVSSRRIKKWEVLEETSAKRINPFINENDSLFNTIKVSLSRKKTEGELDRLIELHTYDLNALIKEENSLYRQIESLSQEENINNYEIEKIYHTLRPQFGLKMVDGYQNEFIKIEEDIFTMIKDSEKRVDKLNKLVNDTEQY